MNVGPRLTPHEWAQAQKVCTPKQLRILGYWNQGYGYTRIGAFLGIGRDNARGYIDRALARIRPPELSERDRLLREQSRIFWEELERARGEGDVEPDYVKCYLCGKLTPGEDLQLDHVIPRAAGGTNDPSNKLHACSTCNASKQDRIVSFDVTTRQPTYAYRPR